MIQCCEGCLHCLVGIELTRRDSVGIHEVGELVQAIGDIIASLPTQKDRLDYAIRVTQLTGGMLAEVISGSWADGKVIAEQQR